MRPPTSDINATPFPPPLFVFGAGLALVIGVYFLLSNLALNALGLNYETPGGNPLEKIHPATFLAVLLLGLATLTRRKPLADGFAGLASAPGAVLLIISAFLLMAHSILITGLPFTQLIDALIAPVIVFFLFRTLSTSRASRLGLLIHAIFFVNAILAVAEFSLGFRLTPLIAIGTELTSDWRSSAFFGHPLAGASLTGTYLLALALGGGRNLPILLRLMAAGASAVAMVTFGGRAATVFLLVFITLIGIARLAAIMRGVAFSRASLLGGMLAVPVTAIAIVAAADAGYLDLFLSRFTSDDGSAQSRLNMLELFRFVPTHELLLAPDPALITSLRSLYRLDFGIESFWVAFILTYGLIPSLPVFIGLLLFGRDVVRASDTRARWLALFVIAVASTSTSLSSKTTVLTTSVILIVTLLRANPVPLTASPLRQSTKRSAVRLDRLRHRTC